MQQLKKNSIDISTNPMQFLIISLLLLNAEFPPNPTSISKTYFLRIPIHINSNYVTRYSSHLVLSASILSFTSAHIYIHCTCIHLPWVTSNLNVHSSNEDMYVLTSRIESIFERAFLLGCRRCFGWRPTE